MARNIRRLARKSTIKIARDFLARVPSSYLFPLRAGAKKPPLLKNELELAFNDEAAIKVWAEKAPGCNWGVANKKSRLIVMDVDVKPGKVGRETLDNLELMHGQLPPTLTVRTPSGGLHYYFKETNTVRHVMRVSAFGQDVDSTNYVVLPGCVLDPGGDNGDGGAYTIINDAPITPAPDWFAEYLDKSEAPAVEQVPEVELDQDANVQWAIDYLTNDSPPCIQGKNGENTMLLVYGTLKDRGISLDSAIDLVERFYNVPEKCDPVWNLGDGSLADRHDIKGKNAYGYLKENAPGSATAQAAFGDDPVEPSTLPAEMVAEGERQQAAMKAAGKETWESIKAGWVYIGQQKQFVRLSDGKMWDVDGFEKQFGYVKDGMRDAMGRPPGSLTKAIFSCPPGLGLRTFDSFVFMPGEAEDYRGNFNQWRKSEIEPKEGDTSLWDAHLLYLFPDERSRNVVLDWLAWVFQNPTLHPNHSLLIHGKVQGTGKSFVFIVLGMLLSATPATPLSQHTLELDHNGWITRTKLAIVEIRAANKKLSDILHDLITAPMVHVDMKGAHDFDMPNVLAFGLESNKDDALTGLDNSDRRHGIVSTDQPNKPLLPREPSYYAKLYGVNGEGGLLNDPAGLAAVAHALKTRDLKGYNGAGRAPFTEAKKAMMRASADGVEKWLVEHHDEAPLSLSLVGVEEILTALPDDLRDGRGARERVAAVLAGPEFNGENIGRVRFGGRKEPQRRLWAINRTVGAASVRERFNDATLAKMYRREHWRPSAADMDEIERNGDEARQDFADNPA
jgi:hypothetical protein